MKNLPEDVARCQGTTDVACNHCARREIPGLKQHTDRVYIEPEIKPNGWCRNAVPMHVIRPDRSEEHSPC